jgi:AraC-like DNA-binding protein
MVQAVVASGREVGGVAARYREGAHEEAQSPGKEPRAVRRLREHIESHYAEAVTLADLASLVSLSKFHMLRVFRASVGLPPHAFLTRVRILHAQALIRAGVSLTRVALDTGFSDQSHLIRHFKRALGVTPGAYARSCADVSRASS